MHSFLGEYEVALDSKGRFVLPAGFRKQLAEGSGEQFVINRGLEPCLVLYTMDVWNKLSAKINTLNDFNPKERALKRVFLNGAALTQLDAAGRLLIAPTLKAYAKLDKNLILSAQGNKLEIWDRDAYNEYMNQHLGQLSALAEEVGKNETFNPFAD